VRERRGEGERGEGRGEERGGEGWIEGHPRKARGIFKKKLTITKCSGDGIIISHKTSALRGACRNKIRICVARALPVPGPIEGTDVGTASVVSVLARVDG
jgi:hypothetical protein